MFLDDPVNLAVRRLIRQALDLPAGFMQPANQTGSPAGGQSAPFATVLITTATPLGYDQVREQNDTNLNLLQSQSGMYHIVGSVQFFREGATSFARRLKGTLETGDSAAFMQSQNIGLIGLGPVLNLSALVDTFYEERAQLNIEIYAVIEFTQSVPTYGTFPISVTVGGKSVNFETSE